MRVAICGDTLLAVLQAGGGVIKGQESATVQARGTEDWTTQLSAGNLQWGKLITLMDTHGHELNGLNSLCNLETGLMDLNLAKNKKTGLC